MRNTRVNSPGGEVRLLATDANLEDFVERQSFKEGDPAQVWNELQAGDAIAVSRTVRLPQRQGRRLDCTLVHDLGRQGLQDRRHILRLR